MASHLTQSKNHSPNNDLRARSCILCPWAASLTSPRPPPPPPLQPPGLAAPPQVHQARATAPSRRFFHIPRQSPGLFLHCLPIRVVSLNAYVKQPTPALWAPTTIYLLWGPSGAWRLLPQIEFELHEGRHFFCSLGCLVKYLCCIQVPRTRP